MSREDIPTIEASAIPQHDTATKRRKYLMPAMLSEINLRHYSFFGQILGLLENLRLYGEKMQVTSTSSGQAL